MVRVIGGANGGSTQWQRAAVPDKICSFPIPLDTARKKGQDASSFPQAWNLCVAHEQTVCVGGYGVIIPRAFRRSYVVLQGKLSYTSLIS